jgi:hypothetical protein
MPTICWCCCCCELCAMLDSSIGKPKCYRWTWERIASLKCGWLHLRFLARSAYNCRGIGAYCPRRSNSVNHRSSDSSADPRMLLHRRRRRQARGMASLRRLRDPSCLHVARRGQDQSCCPSRRVRSGCDANRIDRLGVSRRVRLCHL